MGVENFVDAANSGKRQNKRARVLLAVKLELPDVEIEGRLRDLSHKGALVECNHVPPVGTELLFKRGSTIVPARVAWAGGNRVGLEFAYMIDESELLVQLRKASPDDQAMARYRRPGLFEQKMSEGDRKLARAWGASVGIKLPRD